MGPALLSRRWSSAARTLQFAFTLVKAEPAGFNTVQDW